jgi:hypothetical protein
MELEILNKKHRWFTRVVIGIISLLCFGLFLGQSIQCWGKFKKNPEHSEVKFKPSRNNDFPAFTLCPHENSTTKIEDLQIETIDIRTYSENSYIFEKRNLTLLQWKIAIITGKSLSEALVFASTNPQYDDRLIIELQVQYMKITSSTLGRTCCVQKLFLTFRTIFVHNMFSPCSAKRRASDKDFPVQVNLFQKHLFLHQLTQNRTKDCSLNYKFST